MENILYNPQTDDLWITGLFGDAHFYPKGSEFSLCGKGWESQVWNMSVKRPLDLCRKCEELCKAH